MTKLFKNLLLQKKGTPNPTNNVETSYFSKTHFEIGFPRNINVQLSLSTKYLNLANVVSMEISKKSKHKS